MLISNSPSVAVSQNSWNDQKISSRVSQPMDWPSHWDVEEVGWYAGWNSGFCYRRRIRYQHSFQEFCDTVSYAVPFSQQGSSHVLNASTLRIVSTCKKEVGWYAGWNSGFCYRRRIRYQHLRPMLIPVILFRLEMIFSDRFKSSVTLLVMLSHFHNRVALTFSMQVTETLKKLGGMLDETPASATDGEFDINI
jgi:hypothetical protein